MKVMGPVIKEAARERRAIDAADAASAVQRETGKAQPSPPREVFVFLSVRTVYRHNRTIAGHVAHWIALGTSTTMYTSAKCATPARAEELAKKFRARNPWLVVPHAISTPAEATPSALCKLAARQPPGDEVRRALVMAAARIEALELQALGASARACSNVGDT